MKRKKLTLNFLVFGNLKNRKKQYVIMIIGIILAMLFSSTIIISYASLQESFAETRKNVQGSQDIVAVNLTEEDIKQAKEDGYIADAGIGYLKGFAHTNKDDEQNGFFIGWIDDTAKKLSYQSFVEGSYPVNENEIAIEKSALARLGIDAKIGDEIALSVHPQNGSAYINHSESKTYKLVGILNDKADSISSWLEYGTRCIPAAFVCENVQTGAGGKESMIAYIFLADFAFNPIRIEEDLTYKVNKIDYFIEQMKTKYNFNFLQDETNEYTPVFANTNEQHFYSETLMDLQDNLFYIWIIGAVLALTSCFAVVNSFNSNIKERRQQIGMLRAVGTTKRQIVTMLLKESFIISVLCVPVSVLLSCLFVFLLSLFFKSGFVFKIDILSVVACAVVGLFTVIIASLIPALYATKITPMQAIRNIETARKMKSKKIKSKRGFSVPKLLAQRNMAFHKGITITVSLLLTFTIVLSCAGFSFLTDFYANSDDYDYAYRVSGFSGGNTFANFEFSEDTLSDYDKQNICAAPYISKSYGVKRCAVNVLIDEYTDYFKIFTASNVFEMNSNAATTAENYVEATLSDFDQYYLDMKSSVGIEKEILPTSLVAIDDWKLEELSNHLVSGEIHLDKLASGEEVVLVAPQKAALGYIVQSGQQGGYSFTAYDENIKNESDFILIDEYEYRAGDTLDLCLIYGEEDTDIPDGYNMKKSDKQVKIGAVISPDYFNDSNSDFYISEGKDYFVLTSLAGINRFYSNVPFENIMMFVDGEINDEMDETITKSVENVLYKFDNGISVMSAYASEKRLNNSYNSMAVSILSLIIICFAVCASLVNNSFTANIRERKKELGTLRAVGISRKEFVQSYVKRLLHTLLVGYAAGFGIFVLIYVVTSVYVHFKNQSIMHYIMTFSTGMLFNPWITIAFCIILFAVCSINLWLKISKEMKNSIIDNIREL